MKSVRLARAALLLLFLAVACLSAQIAIYGDTQSNDDVHAKVVAGILSHSPQIAFHTGDLTSNGTKRDRWERFFSISGPLMEKCPLYPAMGNHEKSAEIFLERFPHLGDSTYYTVPYDSLLFVILDSNQDLMPRSGQYEWLLQTLERDREVPKIVLMHHPVFSSGWHGGEEGFDLILPDLFTGRGVIAVFAGHDHNYERLAYGDITFIVCGGGGGTQRPGGSPSPYSAFFKIEHSYMILERKGRILDCTAYGLEGQAIDRFQIPLP